MTRQVPRPEREAAKTPGFDLSFRPATYWPEDSLRLAVLGNVQGETRRRLILEALESGTSDIPPEGLLQPVLQPDLRAFLGKIHPILMGGEYLPDYLPTEVEIARVAMRSTTGDVISIRARLEEDARIHYRVVDEYETAYELSFDETEFPLTAGELLRLMDEAQWDYRGIVLGVLEGNVEFNGGDHMRGFLTVSSNFYPGLGTHYHDCCEAYLDTLEKQEDVDEE